MHNSGDIFADPAAALVNPVNCVGVAGAGLALQFRRRFPAAHAAYVGACRAGMVPGQTAAHFERGRWIIAFATKRHWRDRSELEPIRRGLEVLARDAAHTVASIAIPALGCGLGGLRWDVVRPLILQAFDCYDITVGIYAPR